MTKSPKGFWKPPHAGCPTWFPPVHFNQEKYGRVGYSFSMVFPDEDLLRHIALVICHWGMLELKINQYIKVFHVGLKRELPARWQWQSFKQRKELFCDVAWEVFPDDIGTYLKAQAAKAADLHWRRNAVAHGRYGDEAWSVPHQPRVQAVGEHKGRTVVVQIDEPTLEKLWHDIGYVTGSLTNAYEIDLEANGMTHELPLPDRSRLQVFWRCYFQSLPKAPMPPPASIKI